MRWRAAAPLLLAAAIACGDATATETGGRLLAISAGTDHACADVQGGTVVCWGANREGQLGLPGGRATTPLSPILGPLSLHAVAAGRELTCALTPRGRPFCWGRGDPAPRRTGGVPALARLAAGEYACGLTGAGAIWCWDAPGADGVQLTGAGYSALTVSTRICALDPAGAATCWDSPQTAPVTLSSGPALVALATGDSHACGLDGTGTVWCWGANNRGQLGDGTTSAHAAPAPIALGDGTPGITYTAVTAGPDNSCAIATDGSAHCWGLGESGQLGYGGTNPTPGLYVSVPVTVVGGKQWARLAGGGRHTCGLVADGTAWCWGANLDGELGTGDLVMQVQPTEVQW